MNARRPSGQWNWLALTFSALALIASPYWRGARGQLAGKEGDVYSALPFDRITLIDGTVLDIEPVSPRPLPPYDPKKDTSKATDKQAVPREGNIFIDSQKELIARAALARKAQEEQINELTIKPLDREGLYRVRRASVKALAYYEDLLLAEADQYRQRRDFIHAFERLMKVKERAPNWAGLDGSFQRLLFEEGALALQDGDTRRGLRLLRDLHGLKPDYPGLGDVLAKAFRGRVQEAFDRGAFAEGRRVLHDLEALAGDHPALAAERARFIERAEGLADQSKQAEGLERLDLLTEALRVWPKLDVVDRYEAAFKEAPTLDVGVLELPEMRGPWARCPVEDRAARLVYLPLLAADDEDALRGRRADQLLENVEIGEVGRRLTLTLRANASWSDDFGPVLAADVARGLIDRAGPGSPAYQARWAELVSRVAPVDERQVLVEFVRAPLKPAAWLLTRVAPARADRWGLVPQRSGSVPVVGTGAYRPIESAGTETHSYRAREPSTAIQRVREVRFPSPETALAALRRGDITLLEAVPPDQIAPLARDPELSLGRYAAPRLHVIALDGRNPVLRNRSLRRGLSYAIDRATLLEESLFHGPPGPENLPLDGLFDRESYANAPEVKPLPHDPLLARMLVAAARKELGGSPLRLTFEFPALAEARAVAPKLVEAFNAAGIELEVVERTESELETALRAGRRFDLAYRVVTCLEPMTDAGPMICPGYDAPPSADGLGSIASPRTLDLLLDLERATQFPIARGLVIQLDRESRDELPVIPLWQLRHHYAWRKRLKGPAEAAEYLYQGITKWEIDPWIARDSW